MKAPFELEWLGGPAEHHFRRARPDVNDVPWGTLVPARYPQALLDVVRASWTEVAINEYRAAASFAEVVRALVDVMAPLDLIGMASDALSDEVLHVELASRLAMELGGAAPRAIDTDRFAIRGDPRRSAFERANEVVVRICCVGEAMAAGIGAANMKVSSHPLVRAVYEIILADEAKHRRVGSLYMEWASERMDDAERARLATIAASALGGLAGFWRQPAVPAPESPACALGDLHELGWLEPAKAAPHAREVARTHVVAPLASLGIEIEAAEVKRLLE